MDHLSGTPRKRRLTAQGFLPFEEARAFAQTLGIKNVNEWYAYCTSGMRPENIPTNPGKIYKDQWKGYGDWLATARIANQKREFLPFEEARAFVHTLGLKSREEWKAYYKSGEKAANIPTNPYGTYGVQFQGWGDWLGTDIIWGGYREYLPFEEARAFVHTLNVKDQKGWQAYSALGQRPASIPADPRTVYGEQFLGYGDWLGTHVIANHRREYLPFEEARIWVHSLGVKSVGEWYALCASNKIPTGIPKSPRHTYKDRWRGWGDWLGTGKFAPFDPRFVRVSPEHKRAQKQADSHLRRARKRAVLGNHTHQQIREMLKRHRYKCYYCGNKLRKKPTSPYGYDFHTDHTFPLSRVTGTNIPANSIEYLVPSCPPCNDSKGNKFPHEWPQGGRLL